MFLQMNRLNNLALIACAATALAQSGTGQTTRYWDCCKGSCGWAGKAPVGQPIQSCDKSDNPLADMAAANGCEEGGNAYMCSNQSPWAESGQLAYGFAAVKLANGTESSWCCACYKLTFMSGPVQGQQMIVQATNTGSDLGDNHFDLAIPGGGVGLYNACTDQWGAPPQGWGEQYGGVASRADCDNFPEKLKSGCYWRFDWFKSAEKPDVSFEEIECPAALTEKTGCIREGGSNDLQAGGDSDPQAGGDTDFPVGGGNDPQAGGGNDPQVGGGTGPQVGGGNGPQGGRGTNPQVGGGTNPQLGGWS